MRNFDFKHKKTDTYLIGRCLGLITLLTIAGCSSKDSAPSAKESTAAESQSRKNDIGAEHLRTRDNRLDNRRNTDDESAKKNRRSRNEKQLRQWASQHIYMRLCLEHLKLTEEQLTKVGEMNWQHFFALEEMKAKRPALTEELIKMLTRGQLDKQAFEKDQAWIAENEALRKAQYKERMETLHTTLTPEQRTQLVGLVESEQKKSYAEQDKIKATISKPKPPTGCGGTGNRFMNRFIDDRELSPEQKAKFAQLRTELDSHNPSAQQVEENVKAGRLFDLILRRAFIGKSFEVAKLVPPQMQYSEPKTIAKCHEEEFQALLGILSEEQRQSAAERLKQRITRRQGEMPDAPADGGQTD